MIRFADRVDAGRQLSAKLLRFRSPDVVVLGLPRGGVPVAAEVAQALGAPLDVIVVRKLGVPFQPELAMGAIGEDGVRVLDTEVLRATGVDAARLDAVEARERAELEARVVRFRRGRPRLDLTGKTALIVDDGIATGSTARAACLVARHLGARRVVVAAPVAARDVESRLTDADEVVCVSLPRDFTAVGVHYRDFTATTDDEVVALLEAASAAAAERGSACDEDVHIPFGSLRLEGHLCVPPSARGVVLFAHGSGSSRHSPRNQYVARVLQEAGLGTLLMDLLTPAEEHDRARVFDIEELAARLAAATRWLGSHPSVAGLALGYFGASTGAAAALWAAAEDDRVGAVVSRGGRPDLAGPVLGAVHAPTLLIVGGNDRTVLDLNRWAQAQLTCPTELAVVPGATHLFEEPGTLARAAELARDWFTGRLAGAPPVAGREVPR